LASLINADNGVVSGSSGVKTTADTSGVLALQSNGSTGVTLNTDLSVTFAGAQTLSAGTANGVTYLNGSKVLTSGSGLVFDGANLGLAVTPSVYWGGNKGLDVGSPGCGLTSRQNNEINLCQNAAFNVYATTGAAAIFGIGNNGQFAWNQAASGTAGNTITFTTRMLLDTSGQLGIGTTSANATLHAQGATTTDGSIKFNQQLNSTGAYNSSPQSGSLVALKYNSGGELAGMGGWSIGKENATDNNYSSYFAMHTRANGGAITERARIDSSGNLLVGATSSTGSASNTAITISGNFQTASGSVSAPSSTPTAVATLPTVNVGTWIVCIGLSTGVAGTWSSTYVLNMQGTSSNIGALLAGSGSGLGISMSGTSLRVQQGSGATQTVYWSITRIF